MSDTTKELEAFYVGSASFVPENISIIRLTGSDRISFLHQISTQDIKALKVGDVSMSALLSATSHVLALFHILILEDSVLLIAQSPSADQVIQLLDKYLITEDVALDDVTSQFSLVALFGKAAENYALPQNQLTLVPQKESVMHFKQTVGKIEGVYFLIPTGESWNKHKDLITLSATTKNIIRFKESLLLWGEEIDSGVMLSETKLEKVIASETKGCYPGQEVVAKIETYGRLNRAVTKIVFDKKEVLTKDTPVLNSEKKVIGTIKSSALDDENKALCFALLKKGYYEEACEVSIENSAGIKLNGKTVPIPTFTKTPAVF